MGRRSDLVYPDLNRRFCDKNLESYACRLDDTCVAKAKVCDGAFDCADGSDETLCDEENNPNAAPECECDKATCLLPTCWCSMAGTFPIRRTISATPQFVVLTFGGNVHEGAKEQVETVFGNEVKTTFFVHTTSNFKAIKELHDAGHEIGILDNGIYGQRESLSESSGIPLEDIIGFRSETPEILDLSLVEAAGFKYDSSDFAPSADGIPFYPYTLHHKRPHPTKLADISPHSLWAFPTSELNVPVIQGQESNFNRACSTLTACNLKTSEDVYEILVYNFVRNFNTNRAPLMIKVPLNWLNRDLISGVAKFVSDVKAEFTTLKDLLAWVEEPQSL